MSVVGSTSVARQAQANAGEYALIRRTPTGIHSLGEVECEIKGGEVVYKEGDGTGHGDRTARWKHERAHFA